MPDTSSSIVRVTRFGMVNAYLVREESLFSAIERIDPVVVVCEAREQADVRKKKREGMGAL